MNQGFLVLLGLAVSYGLTGLLRRYALKRSLMDVPNARSSHTVPTPRGGGVAIVASFLLVSLIMALSGSLSGRQVLALIAPGILVAVLGFMDDHGHIAARWRLLGHFGAALLALFCIGGMPAIPLPWTAVEPTWWLLALGSLYLVWMLNLYNFMDGIDGIASVQAITTCLGICLIYALAGHLDLVWAPLLLAAAVAGFLLWNFPPAKIFMGDAGSGFLGLVLAVMSLQGAWTDGCYFWVWLILMGVFIVDATFTLFRRLLRGDKVYEAHRSHAYQYASRYWRGHRPVTLCVAALNVFWLLPIGFAVIFAHLPGLVGVMLAYAPLVVLAGKYHAGARESASAAI